MSQFEFFFAFYGLILGLAVAEVLNGLGGVLRARELKRVGVPTALATAFLLLVIAATWIDAWNSLQTVSLTFAGLARPFLVAVCYYLCAVILFPKDLNDWPSLDVYFAERKAAFFGLILIAEFALTSVYLESPGYFSDRPGYFWTWWLPYNITLHGLMAALIVVRNRRAVLIMLGGLILLFLIPYWVIDQIMPSGGSPS
jgi:hypothetical protein